MDHVPLHPRSTAGLAAVLGDEDGARLDDALARLADLHRGRSLWHVTSTAQGGGVAEMLAALLPYVHDAGVDVHWLVIGGTPEFFPVTKRLHNHLHGSAGDGGPLGEQERALYDRSLATELDRLLAVVRPRDVVVLHDPQTAGLVRGLRLHGAHVVWRCHVGVDEPTPEVRRAWDFLRGDVAAASACVFSRPAYVWDGLPAERAAVIAPCIDVVAPKNQILDVLTRDAILATSGLVSGRQERSDLPPPRFAASDGAVRTVARRATLVEEAPVPESARLVVQVSRWDRLKDPVGVLHGFAFHGPLEDVHLMLAGPSVAAVVDDPEGAEVLDEVRRAWEALPEPARRRCHLATLPMDDADENAAIVNALQRRADVVVQKSLAEGFGLTVAEAMWKRRPVVASRVGGVQDQIVHGESGLLIDDPRDLAAFGAAVVRLLEDGDLAREVGEAAHDRVRAHFLPVHHFAAEAALLGSVLAP